MFLSSVRILDNNEQKVWIQNVYDRKKKNLKVKLIY